MRRDSDIASVSLDWRRLSGALRLALVSTLALAGLVGFLVFLVARAADERARALLVTEIDRSAATIADALSPVLRAASPGDAALIAEAMRPYAAPDRILRLYFSPTDGTARGLFFITGAPAQALGATDAMATQRVSGGALDGPSAACRPGPRTADTGVGEFLWALMPIASPSGCWWLVATTAVAASGPSFFTLPPIRSTGLAAAAAALLMLAALVLAMTQARRMRADGAHPYEITAVDDPELLPQPANDLALAGDPVTTEPEADQEGGNDTTAILDQRRGVVDLSTVVRSYAGEARVQLGADAERLQVDLEDGVLIDGRAEYVHTILDEVVGPALRAPLGGRPIEITLRAEDLDTRPSALLMVTVPSSAAVDDAGGRRALIKQFALALAAAASVERRSDGSETVRLRFPVSGVRGVLRTDAG